MAVCYPEIKRLGAEVLVVSKDTVNDHKVWNEVELSRMVCGGIPFPMLEDRNGQISRLYGISDEVHGISTRARFVIDPYGIMQAAVLQNSSVGTSIPETIRILRATQYHLATGDAVPANWLPGKPTLKRDINLSGHVWQVWRPERQC